MSTRSYIYDQRHTTMYDTTQCKLPSWILDVIAEEKLNQGYNNKQNPICNKCYVRKSVVGTCNCDE